MEVRLKTGGMEAVIVVENAAEAAKLLATLSQHNVPTGTPDQNGYVTEPVFVPEDQLRKVLMMIKGKPAAKVLKIIADHGSEGCTDKELREHSSFASNMNLGPVFSLFSKTCKKVGVKKIALFKKQVRRGLKGKMHYKYTITETAANLINSIDKFEDEEAEYEPDF